MSESERVLRDALCGLGLVGLGVWACLELIKWLM